jgi:hypothetical protein
MKTLYELYVRFMVWLGAASPAGYEYFVSSVEAKEPSFTSPTYIGFRLVRIFIPFDGFVIQTNLSSEAVKQKLAEVVEPYKPFIVPFSHHKRYQGEINDNKFKFSKIIFYRNSFLPVIQGEIYPKTNGTSIEITLRLGVVWYLCLDDAAPNYGDITRRIIILGANQINTISRHSFWWFYVASIHRDI